MGQRHQIFVKIANPVKFAYFNSEAEKEKAINIYGELDHTILAYHNQWLYGRSALQQCISLLTFGEKFSQDEKSTDKGYSYDCPFSPRGYVNNFAIDEIPKLIGFILNYRPNKTEWLSQGFGKSWFLNETEPNMRDYFNQGDNNDGITIIDLIENKYCFMNINNQRDLKNRANSASDLVLNKPSSANDYVKCYYGETLETCNDYYLKDKTPKQQEKVILDNIRINKKACKGFEKFEVLTKAELRVMFPKMDIYQQKNKVV